MIDVRAAIPDDALELAELRWEFRSGRVPAVEPHDRFIERCTDWMRRALTAGDPWRAWVAASDGRVVGQVWLDLLEKIPNPVAERERHAYLSNLYVRPAARGGTGTRLLQSALAWARANGVDRVVLWPTDASVALYARHGFIRGSDVMELTC
jgi:GNAT superfamily N-acetyltransferase